MTSKLIISALVIIDLQRAIDDPRWLQLGPRNNLDAELNIEKLLLLWRHRQWPIVHVRHSSIDVNSTYASRGPGFVFKLAIKTSPREVVVTKRCNSAFVNTALHAELKQLRVDALTICGVTTNHSVDATVRHAASLGYRVTLVVDGCAAFPLRLASGEIIAAQQLHDIFTANLAGEYCQLRNSDELL